MVTHPNVSTFCLSSSRWRPAILKLASFFVRDSYHQLRFGGGVCMKNMLSWWLSQCHNPLFYGVNGGKMKKTTYCRWTTYSNPRGKDWNKTPLPQMSKLNNVCVTCHAVGFDLFCPPVSTLGVVQGLKNLSIYGIIDVWPCLTHHMGNIWDAFSGWK